jgi:DedD protein
VSRPIDDTGEYYERRTDPNRADREISLGTPTILGIFFAIALLCAAFFGFGYSMGHTAARNAQPVAVATTPQFGMNAGVKPSAASPAGHTLIMAAPSVAAPAYSQTTTPQTAVVPLSPSASKNSVSPSDRMIAGDKPASVVATQAAAVAAPVTGPLFVVQVAAVSSQDVADILLNSLEKKGYTVAVHHEPQDKLLHVQIGPFTDRKDAEAMQKRVLADGFNAIVK